ncbi:MAG TPA: enoyl-CoA hydratase/isomerase family protein [Dehalococcoidia bacterium]|nr:enoyl-CoA hydratase/isomerase family protein [Dehalococcoidia bacterium]
MDPICIVEREGHVATVRMNRPDKHNAFNRELDAAVGGALRELDADDAVHCAILTGTGAAFSAGADMNEAVASIEGKGRSEGMAGVYAAVAAFRKPLIAAVNGICYGGGALVATMCDIRIASDTAAFRFPGAAYGLVVGGSALPRLVGPASAKELLFTARVVRADEALRIGLVNAVVPHADIAGAALDMARQIAANSPAALIATKHTVDRATEVDAGAEAEAEWNRGLRTSPEHHERFRAAAERVARRGDE